MDKNIFILLKISNQKKYNQYIINKYYLSYFYNFLFIPVMRNHIKISDARKIPNLIKFSTSSFEQWMDPTINVFIENMRLLQYDSIYA